MPEEKALSQWYDLGDTGACVPEYMQLQSMTFRTKMTKSDSNIRNISMTSIGVEEIMKDNAINFSPFFIQLPTLLI